MRNFAASAVLLLALLITSEALYIRKGIESSPLEALRKMREKGASFASNLISNIELHLTSGGKVDDVIELVQQARSDAQSQWQNLNTEYNAQIGQLNDQISAYESQLEALNGELTDTLKDIDSLSKEVDDLDATIERLQNDLEAVGVREKNLQDARDLAFELYQKRKQRDETVISVLEEIIPALTNLAENGQAFLQKTQRDVAYALKKIPNNRPIQALVELSTQFNEAKLRTVIEKLSDILDAVQTSKQNDYQSYIKLKAKYVVLLDECDQLRTFKSKQLSQARGEREQKQQALDAAQSKRSGLVANIQSTTQLKESLEKVRDDTDASFQKRLTDSKTVVNSLTEALQILTDNETTLTQQENQANTDGQQ